MLTVQHLLINLTAVILPMIIYQMLLVYKNVSPKANQLLVYGFEAISLLMCLSFRFQFIDGVPFDFRYIAIIKGTFYGGFGVGAALSATAAVYRVVETGIGGVSVATYGLFYTVLFTTLALFIPKWKSANKKGRLVLSALFSCGSIGLLVIALLCIGVPWGPQMWNAILLYSSIQTAVLVLIVYFCEYIRETIEMRKEMDKLESLNVVGQLAASIAHEIRNPLTVIKGSLQLAMRANYPELKKEMLMSNSLEELERIDRIISDYLSIAKPEMCDLEPVNVGEQINSVLEKARGFGMLSDVRVETNLESGTYIYCDRGKFARCLINLLKNAAESMSPGGEIDIRTYRRNRRIAVEICDTGKGMSEEQIHRLGTPFYSTKEKGTGIGLMLVYRYIHSIGGTIDVKSEVGKGSRFVLHIPAYNGDRSI